MADIPVFLTCFSECPAIFLPFMSMKIIVGWQVESGGEEPFHDAPPYRCLL